MNGFENQVAAYVRSVEHFVYDMHLPIRWFGKPDHVAYKCADGEQYESMIEAWSPHAEQRTQIELNNRRLGTIHLVGPLAVGRFGTVEWLEIMEPRLEKVGKDVVGIDHMEFYFPLFDSVRSELDARNIRYENESNPNHAWISIKTPEGHEFKINDKPLRTISEEEIASGAATVLHLLRMRTFKLEELVRDRIPEKMRADGQEVVLRNLAASEKPGALERKLKEGVVAFLQSLDVAEGADVIEAVEAMLMLKGYTRTQIQREVIARRTDRGGFQKARFVETVSMPENSPWVEHFLKQGDKAPEILE